MLENGSRMAKRMWIKIKDGLLKLCHLFSLAFKTLSIFPISHLKFYVSFKSPIATQYRSERGIAFGTFINVSNVHLPSTNIRHDVRVYVEDIHGHAASSYVRDLCYLC